MRLLRPYLHLSIAFSLAITGLNAQIIQRCGSDEQLASEMQNNPRRATLLEETEALMEAQMAQDASGTESVLHVIPVVFHVIWYDEGDNISEAQLLNALEILNEDMRRMNPDTALLRSIFKPVAADMEIEFRIAKKDPAGNCSNGITRTQSNLSLVANNNVKALIGWDNTKYLNIWVVSNINLSGTTPGSITLGYSAFPYNGIPMTQDGIVIRHDNLGSIGTSAGTRHRTLTHEVGHYVNLYHTFQGGCSQGDNCYDTPPVASSSNGCNNSTQNTCSNDSPDLPDMVENYMDYSDDNCMNTFTQNQKSRAKSVLNNLNLRGKLCTAANLAFAGVDGNSVTCSPVADFTVDRTLICTGEQIQFTDLSAYQTLTSFHYTIMDQYGGNQKHIITANPLLTFNADGVYDVKLEIQNAAGNSMKQFSQMITVRPAGGTTYSPFFSAEMENPLPNAIWTVENNGDNIQWVRTSAAAKTGSYSYVLDNFNVAGTGGGDALIAGPIALSNVTANVLKFSHAFARKTSSDNDQLKIFTSIDCGLTWSLARLVPAFQLGISTYQPNLLYIPAAADWKETSVTLTGLNNATSLMIKFELVSGGGNNLYLDDVRFSTTLGEDELVETRMHIAPNPSSGSSNLSLPMAKGTVFIQDATGRVIHELQVSQADIQLPTMPAGTYSVWWLFDSQRQGLARWIVLP
ncbi:MAG: M43 family zinc metalloprotease [Schleiferiaceae bacterium]|nr:M43 family zinc metalloprotease [Schleiferiaceae bacterium]